VTSSDPGSPKMSHPSADSRRPGCCTRSKLNRREISLHFAPRAARSINPLTRDRHGLVLQRCDEHCSPEFYRPHDPFMIDTRTASDWYPWHLER